MVNDVAGRAVVLRVLCDRPRRPEGDLSPGSVWVPSDRASLAAGGIGYLLKARLSSDLTIAIAETLEGRRYVSRL